MSELLLPRAGYAAGRRRSPAALGAALALNGGVVALLIALPAAHIIDSRGLRPIEVRLIPLDPPPPPNPEPVDQKRTQTQLPRPQDPPRPDPTIVPPIIDTGGGTIIAGTLDPVIPETADPPIIERADPPPVFVQARLDPRFAEDFKPVYPPAMRRLDKEGRVTVKVTVDERGRVIAVEQVRASDPAFFEATRAHALRYWRFRPATRGGVPVRSEITLTLDFQLE